MADQSRNIIAASFSTPDGGSRAAGAIGGAFPDKVGNTALLHVKPDGKPKFIESKDWGAGRGALLGGVIGIIGGPIGIVAGGRIGALASKLRDSGFKNDQLEQLGRSLGPGNSAVVVEIAADAVDTAKTLAQTLGATNVVSEGVDSSVADLFAGRCAPSRNPSRGAAAPAPQPARAEARPAGHALGRHVLEPVDPGEDGKKRPQTTASTIVITPPATTAGTAPSNAAATPDSNAPSSFDAPMNTPSTAFTRPRTSFGVASAPTVERMFIDSMSTNPLTARAATESQNQRERPNMTMLAPKTPTEMNNVRPARPPSGLRASMIPAASAPTAVALRRIPSPNGPVCRIERAKSGSSATAPPKSTAKRSSVIAPSRIGVERMKRMPSVEALEPRRLGRGRSPRDVRP